MTQAAQSLHISQPTLSRQIKELEDELDTKLFIRGPRGLDLTDKGQYLYNRAQEIIQLVENTKQNLVVDKDISGTITIGAAETQCLDQLTPTIKKLTDHNPNLFFSIYSGNADALFEKLDAGLLDFGVVIGPFNQSKYEAISLDNKDRWGVLVPNHHPLAEHSSIEIKEALPYPLIVSAQSTVDKAIFAGLGDYRIVANYNLLYNAALLVEAGVGIAVCLDGIVDRSNLTFIPFQKKNSDTLSLIWRKQDQMSPAANLFLEKFRQNQKDSH